MENKEIKEKELILGIDDAGRGPLIGPMALAGCLITPETEEEFRKLGVKDSKMLSPARREFLAKIIRKKSLGFYVTLTHPSEIDSKINRGTNLNTIEAINSAEIILHLTKQRKEKIKIIIDCPSPNRENWKQTVLKNLSLSENITLACEHKADRDYIAVSAASILAKSERESEVLKLKKKIGKDFGSGYTSDSVTINFLKKYSEEHKNDGIFRETWATFKNHTKQKQQKSLGEF